ncbi:MAG TPA: glycosyltransferase family 4 protein [Paenibacillus sp.]|uniref:glycosyltransferase family 4 protein n=1 Tax=Paenibacillus sp. TaxID=58172 RepID=UPI002C86DE86|nr:glycosyltransferase family 4 protein [Paenibacillus sp.]HUC91108.1 glycosyltransferase family 4 protein [Paenibacillus sp.]
MTGFNVQRQRKKLLIVRGSSQYVNPENYNVQEIGLGKVLTQLGWDVTILSSGPKEVINQYGDNLRWIELKRVGGKFGYPRSSFSRILSIGADLIQIQDLTNVSTYIAYAASIRSGTPLVMSYGEYAAKNRIKRWVNHFISASVRGRIRSVLCKTNSAMRHAETLRLPGLCYAPIGIDNAAYINNINENVSLLAEIATSRRSGKKIICHIGRMDKEDNIDFLLSVLHRLGDSYALLLIGEPKKYVQSNEKFAAIQERIICTGKIPNKFIGLYLAASDLYAACSKYEIFGMSAAESIFHGCPVIGYATGGIAEIITDGSNGILMKTRKPEEWAARIAHLFHNGESDELKAGCHETRQQLTWEHRALVYDNVYRNVLKEGGWVSSGT